jgi:hypothetical protein
MSPWEGTQKMLIILNKTSTGEFIYLEFFTPILIINDEEKVDKREKIC